MLAKWLKKKILWDKENTSLGQIILTIYYLCPTGSGLSSLAWNSSHLWTDFSSSPSTSQSCFHGLPTTRAYLQSPRLCSFLSLHLCITGICNPYPPFSAWESFKQFFKTQINLYFLLKTSLFFVLPSESLPLFCKIRCCSFFLFSHSTPDIFQADLLPYCPGISSFLDVGQ